MRTETDALEPAESLASAPGSRLDRASRKRLFAALERLGAGCIRIVEAGRIRRFGAEAAPPELQSIVRVHRARFYRRMLLGGSLGLAAAWLDGDWDCDNLAALFRAALRGLGRERLPRGARPAAAAARFSQRLRANTRRGARRNIRDHYDLGNAFFALFLDRSMTYSAGLFEQPGASLEAAQRAKLDRICRKLALGPHERVLEIGTGWGSFALHAAAHYGCHVTTTTISAAQYRAAARRIAEAGLSERITLLQRDYRDLDGRYDKLVAIEMIEAVGAARLAGFFECCAARLERDGRMLIQAIGVADHYYSDYRRGVDFIQKYVFPGSHCASLGALIAAAAKRSDLRLVNAEDITPHYVTTLRHWRERFDARREEVRALGYPERFIRLWDYYLHYCEAGFAENHVADRQLLFARPGWPGAAAAP